MLLVTQLAWCIDGERWCNVRIACERFRLFCSLHLLRKCPRRWLSFRISPTRVFKGSLIQFDPFLWLHCFAAASWLHFYPKFKKQCLSQVRIQLITSPMHSIRNLPRNQRKSMAMTISAIAEENELSFEIFSRRLIRLVESVSDSTITKKAVWSILYR